MRVCHSSIALQACKKDPGIKWRWWEGGNKCSYYPHHQWLHIPTAPPHTLPHRGPKCCNFPKICIYCLHNLCFYSLYPWFPSAPSFPAFEQLKTSARWGGTSCILATTSCRMHCPRSERRLWADVYLMTSVCRMAAYAFWRQVLYTVICCLGVWGLPGGSRGQQVLWAEGGISLCEGTTHGHDIWLGFLWLPDKQGLIYKPGQWEKRFCVWCLVTVQVDEEKWCIVKYSLGHKVQVALQRAKIKSATWILLPCNL